MLNLLLYFPKTIHISLTSMESTPKHESVENQILPKLHTSLLTTIITFISQQHHNNNFFPQFHIPIFHPNFVQPSISLTLVIDR